MHNPASVLDNDTHKLLRNFDIKTDHLITSRKPDLIVITKKRKKKTCKIVDFIDQADHRLKLKEIEKKDKYLDLALELKTMEHKSDNNINGEWCYWYSHQRIIKGTGRLGKKRTNGDRLNHYIIVNRQNTEKNPGGLRRLSVT